MRNLKRALSLALASIMVLGLMVVGASAAGYEDFTDKGEIKNTEAVSTMVSLGVISGKSDGSYDPAGSLTRAEACTLIARMLGGGKDPILGSNIKSNFKDTQGHWAENYIAYCANLGIIAGVGNGYFKPDDTLTGSAAAKMVLCALGYKPEFEGIGGANWELATNTLATKIKLYNGLETLNPSATISRDDVAQLIYNGVQAQEVEYRNLQGDYSGTLYATDNGTMLENRFGVYKVTGVVMANEYFGLNQASTKAGKTLLRTGYTTDEKGTHPVTAQYNVTTTADMLGKEVVIYVQPTSKLNPNPTDDKVLGDAIVTTKNTVYTTDDLLVDNSSKSNDITKALKAEGLTLPTTATAYVNYAVDNDADTTAEYAALTGRGYTSTFIDNTGDGKVDLVVSYQPSFGKVAVYSTSGDGKITVTNLSKTTPSVALTNKVADDVKGFDKVAKDDYVFYTYIAADSTYYVEKAEGVTVNVTSTKTSTSQPLDSTVVADGTTYKLSSIASTTDIDAASETHAQLTEAVTIGDSAVFYLDKAGYVVYVDEVKSDVKYMMVTDSAKSGDFGDSLIAKVMLSDGTSATVTVSKVDGKKVVASVSSSGTEVAAADDMLATDKIYSYTVDSNGKYELTKINGTIETTAITNNTPTVVSGLVANTSTPIVVKDDSTVTLYTGINNVPTRTSAKVYGVAGSNNVAKVIFVIGGTGATSDTNYMYFLSTTPTVSKDSSGNDVFTYDVVRDGKVTTVVGDSSTITGLSATGMYKVTLTGDKVTKVESDGTRVKSLTNVTVAADGLLSDGTNSYYYNDSTVVYEISSNGTATESSIAAITVKQDSSVTGDNLTVFVGKDTSNSSTALYVFIVK